MSFEFLLETVFDPLTKEPRRSRKSNGPTSDGAQKQFDPSQSDDVPPTANALDHAWERPQALTIAWIQMLATLSEFSPQDRKDLSEGLFDVAFGIPDLVHSVDI